MKKVTAVFCLLLAVISLAACCRCEKEPIVEQNQKLIVPPSFGKMPKAN